MIKILYIIISVFWTEQLLLYIIDIITALSNLYNMHMLLMSC